MPTIEAEKKYHELFHSYMVDSRGKFINKSKVTSFESSSKNGLRLFCADLDDPQRTNMEHGCYLADDAIFIIKSIRIEARFSNPDRFPDFARTTRFILSVGDKPMYILEANILADPNIAVGVTDPDPYSKQGIDVAATEEIERVIAIPPRQCFDGILETYPIFSEKMKMLECGSLHEYAEIKIVLCGDLKTPLKQQLVELMPPDFTDGIDADPEDEPDEPQQVYRGHGTPKDRDFMDIFCENLMAHMRICTLQGKMWSIHRVRVALEGCMGAFPMQKQTDGGFLIPPPAPEKSQSDPIIETEADEQFFADQQPGQEFTDQQSGQEDSSGKWDPMSYLKNKK